MAPIMATKQAKTQFHFSRRISLSVSVRSVYIVSYSALKYMSIIIIILLFCFQILIIYCAGHMTYS